MLTFQICITSSFYVHMYIVPLLTRLVFFKNLFKTCTLAWRQDPNWSVFDRERLGAGKFWWILPPCDDWDSRIHELFHYEHICVYIYTIHNRHVLHRCSNICRHMLASDRYTFLLHEINVCIIFYVYMEGDSSYKNILLSCESFIFSMFCC